MSLSRYLITDYDNNNFTVAQALFNDTGPPVIVPIPWNATTGNDTGNHLSKGSITGISIGISIFLAIFLGLAFLMFRKRSRRRRVLDPNDKWELHEEMNEEKPFTFVPLQEIGPSSVRGSRDQAQELHNTCQVELFDAKSPSGSGQKVRELWDTEAFSNPSNGLHELLDENSASGSGKEVTELLAPIHSSGCGNGMCELPDENTPSGLAKDAEEPSQKYPMSSHGTNNQKSSDEHRTSASDRYTEPPYSAKQSPDSDTSQSQWPSTPATHASTHTSFGALFSPRSRAAKGSTVDRSSKMSSTKYSRSSKTSSTRSTLSRRPSRHRVNLNKKLPQIPREAVKTAIPISIHSIHPHSRDRFDAASANVRVPNKAFRYDRPRTSRVSGQVPRFP